MTPLNSSKEACQTAAWSNTASTSRVHPSICRAIQVTLTILTQWCQKHQIMAILYLICLKAVKDFFVSALLCFSFNQSLRICVNWIFCFFKIYILHWRYSIRIFSVSFMRKKTLFFMQTCSVYHMVAIILFQTISLIEEHLAIYALLFNPRKKWLGWCKF